MMLSKIFGIFCVLLVVSQTKNNAQEYSEYENYDCTCSKEIVLPFDNNKSGASIKPLLNQIVFYSHRDQFTFWYKIIAKESCSLSFRVNPIDTKDDFTMFVYRYNKSDFCEKVYHNKIDPVKPLFFSNKEGKENPYSLGEKTFFAQAGNTYYISILSISINNCGHVLKLYNTSESDTVRIRAVHVPCERDVSMASDKININAMFSSDLKMNQNKTGVNDEADSVKIVRCNITSAQKGKITNPRLRIVDELTGIEVATKQSGHDAFTFNIEKEKNYKVECSALGYRRFDRSMKISEQLQDNVFTIKLAPLKVGENFVMKNIYFHPNTYALRKESEADLARLLGYLLANEDIRIEIQGHTNGNKKIYKIRAYASLGEAWNFSGSAKKLSEKRAARIKEYLVENGVDKNRLVTKGYGGDRMIIENPVTIEEGQKNIRVEAVILEN